MRSPAFSARHPTPTLRCEPFVRLSRLRSGLRHGIVVGEQPVPQLIYPSKCILERRHVQHAVVCQQQPKFTEFPEAVIDFKIELAVMSGFEPLLNGVIELRRAEPVLRHVKEIVGQKCLFAFFFFPWPSEGF